MNSTFIEINYSVDYKNRESELFIETEGRLLKCMKEIMQNLTGKICIDVLTIA